MGFRYFGIVLLLGCVRTATIACDDGRVCPEGTQCGDALLGYCLLDEQLDACAGMLDDATCHYAGIPAGKCFHGVCVSTGCGNGVVEPGEVCDDGNTRPRDQCSADCLSREECGNLIIDVSVGESCDDGNTLDGDGCQHDCQVARCGDDVMDPDEGCDDGNRVDGDGCSADCRSREVCGNGIFDFVTGEVCDDGNLRSSDGCATTCTREDPIWIERGLEAPDQASGAMAWDPIRRVVVFVTLVGSTWEWDGTWWHARRTDAHPTSPLALAHDPIRHRMVLVTASGGTWTWDGATWTPIAQAPSVTSDMAAAYDESRDRFVIYGGQPVATTTLEFDGTTWSAITPPANAPKLGRTGLVYDRAHHRLVAFGGLTDGSQYFDETWAWNGTTWTKLAAAGLLQARQNPRLAYDDAHDRIVLFGSYADTGATDDTWAFTGTAWTKLVTPVMPAKRSTNAIAYDPQRARIVMYGGYSSIGNPIVDETWLLDGSTWSEPSPEVPSERRGSAIAYDAARGVTVLHGGNGARNDTWEYDGNWHARDDVGGPGRDSAPLVYDTSRSRMVMFGGHAGNYLADTWTYDGTAWTQLAPSTSPPVRGDHAMTYDSDRDRVVVFGGFTGQFMRQDTWEFDGTTWVERTPATSPPSRYAVAAAYDAVRKRTVMFGGEDSAGLLLGDTWEWDGTTWTNATPVGSPSPTARRYPRLVFDPVRERVVLLGGGSLGGMLADVWEWSGTAWIERHPNDAPPPRGEPAVTYDRRLRAIVRFGGSSGLAAHANDTWLYRWSSSVPEETCHGFDADGDGAIDCADPDCAGFCP